ncbi:MAG: hypothetical protein Q9197_004103 [Variospora fuerteventurae]
MKRNYEDEGETLTSHHTRKTLKDGLSESRVEHVDNRITVNSWWTGAAKDGQEPLSYNHMMLLAQSITIHHRNPENEDAGIRAETVLEDRTPVVAIQVLAELLSTQNDDGTWGSNDSTEETTRYAVLALLELASLPYAATLKTEIQNAISKGHEALSIRKSEVPNGQQSRSLSDIHPNAIDEHLHAEGQRAQAKQTAKIDGFINYFSSLDHIRSIPQFRVKASVLEASLYRPFLKAARGNIFPPTASKDRDKYLDYIPIMWLLAGAHYNVFVPPEYLLDMMILSMWIFLTDEYMESKIVKLSSAELRMFRQHVDELYTTDLKADTSQEPSRSSSQVDSTTTSTSPLLHEAKSVFTTFANHVITYPRVTPASATDLLDLRFETKNYLLHHLDQLSDNARLISQQPQSPPTKRIKFLTPRTTFQTWLHTTAAGHISGPFAWAFFTCCMSSSLRRPSTSTPSSYHHQGKCGDCFSTPRQKLISHTMNAHYGAFCRLYNDYGSVRRDAEEGNLNSINFPEFFPPPSSLPAASSSSSSASAASPSSENKDRDDDDDDEKKAKNLLLEAANWERESALRSAALLYRELEDTEEGKRLADRIKVYVGAGEQFSDMYLTRDVTNSVK